MRTKNQFMRRVLLLLMTFVSVIYVEAQVTLPVDSIKTVVKDSIVTAPAPASFISFNKGTVVPISISSNLILSSTQPGSKFSGVLSMDIIADDGKILAQNSKVQGEVLSVKKGGRLAGASEMVLKLRFIKYKNKYHPIRTYALKLSTENAGKKTVRNVGTGAAVGAVFNGGKGAGRGAALMGGMQLLSNNGEMMVPKGFVLNFTLEEKLKLEE
jgi:hypothetical protein